MSYRDYVFQINSENYSNGVGFIVGDRFYTCAHVVKNCVNPFIRINERKVYLENAEFLRYDENNAFGLDIAVFQVQGVNSPLSFSLDVTAKGMKAKCPTWRTVAQGSEYLECEAVVNDEEEGNYFGADTDELLREGASGSPLILDSKVAGMLCAGEVGTPFCLFLSSKAIIEEVSNGRS